MYRPYLCTDYRPCVIASHGACGHICPCIHMHACLRVMSACSRSGSPHDALHRTSIIKLWRGSQKRLTTACLGLINFVEENRSLCCEDAVWCF